MKGTESHRVGGGWFPVRQHSIDDGWKLDMAWSDPFLTELSRETETLKHRQGYGVRPAFYIFLLLPKMGSYP